MYQSEVKVGQLYHYMSRLVLVLKLSEKRDGFVLGLEVGETRQSQYNVCALKPMKGKKK